MSYLRGIEKKGAIKKKPREGLEEIGQGHLANPLKIRKEGGK